MQKQLLDTLHSVVDNINSQEKKVDENFRHVDERFNRVDTAMTLIGGDVDQLKQRVAKIERHLEMTGRSSGH